MPQAIDVGRPVLCNRGFFATAQARTLVFAALAAWAAACTLQTITPTTSNTGVAGAAGNGNAMPENGNGPNSVDNMNQTNPALNGPSKYSCDAGLGTSAWVKCGSNDALDYATDSLTGGRVLNFSGAGYRGGDAPLPQLPLGTTVSPSGSDDTAAIQAALTLVSQRPLDANQQRGKVLLAPGNFSVSNTLNITASGVSLEGTASMGAKQTTVTLTGSATTLVQISGSSDTTLTGSATTVPTAYPPAASTVAVASAAGFNVGDTVQITNSRNLAWITMVWGGVYPPTRDGAKQIAWGSNLDMVWLRQITAVSGNTLSFDAPLSDALLVGSYATGTTVQKANLSGWLSEVGVGHLKLQGRFVPGDITVGTLNGIQVTRAQDCWFDDLDFTDFGSGALTYDASTRHITAQDLRILRTAEQTNGAGYPADLTMVGQQHLMQTATFSDSDFYLVNQTETSAGPMVAMNFHGGGGDGTIEPHRRWSTGLLTDNAYMPGQGIAYINRYTYGTGHGWTMTNGVVYNSTAGTTSNAKTIGHQVYQPPSGANYDLGGVGSFQAPASDRVETHGTPVNPPSLWAHQLYLRRGSPAFDLVMGPWHILDYAASSCLAAQAAQAGSVVTTTACPTAGQNGLWELTSHGLVRLSGTTLCLDAGTGVAGATLTLAACAESQGQLWRVQSRAGDKSYLGLGAAPADPNSCVVNAGGNTLLGACDASASSWAFLVTTNAQ